MEQKQPTGKQKVNKGGDAGKQKVNKVSACFDFAQQPSLSNHRSATVAQQPSLSNHATT